MIATVDGILEEKGTDWAVIRVGGISLRVSVPTLSLMNLGSPGERVHLHTHLHVRENLIALYGFSTPEERHLFEELIEVKGVGGRLALSLLSNMPVENLVAALVAGEQNALMKIPGIGKTTAGRLVLELREKLSKEWKGVAKPGVVQDDDVIAALVGLGYSASEARSAARDGSTDRSLPLEERVRLALQGMRKA